ncbi:hypothetical protein EJB05_23957 [Eragrostis curvula]|uniref:Uncharacterized protein n=1 Tax=Eragrostis curvula TaxID=38414 RepID=A0A5J9V9P6_9POAL|nr:hypothetical protein EJB05_23957 [Eragrostis curvula]
MDGRDLGKRKVGETSQKGAVAKKARASDDAVLGGGTGGGGGASPTRTRESATAQDRRRRVPLVGGRSAMNQATINAAGHCRPVRRQLDGPEADHDSRNAAVVGEESRSSADDVSGTAGGDGASSVDTSLTLDVGATASRAWWTRRLQQGGRQIHAESEVASNSGGVTAAASSDGRHIPAVAVAGLPPIVAANDPAIDEVPDDELCPVCFLRMGLSEDEPTYHCCLCQVCLDHNAQAVCPICGARGGTGGV